MSSLSRKSKRKTTPHKSRLRKSKRKTRLRKSKRKTTMRKKNKSKKYRKNQKGKGKTITYTPSEYYDIKNNINYKLGSIVARYQGDINPVNPNPTYQHLEQGKFDISPSSSLLMK